jgi:hypothetical protein
MTEDPYRFLGDQLLAAAQRREARGQTRPEAHGRTRPEARGHTASGLRARLSRRLNAAAMVAALVLVGGAVAVAATGLLNGGPVPEPEGPLKANAANGVAVGGGSHLLGLRVADPEGGPPWGMRLVRTTRGQVCVQIGRVHDGQLGELGVDGAFHDDGRFHPLAPDILPVSSARDAQCVSTTQTFTGIEPSQDRSAASIPPAATRVKPPAHDLRSISYGLLGPHAVGITIRTKTGTRTLSVSHGAGAYLIVRSAGRVIHPFSGARLTLGYAGAHSIRPVPQGAVRAITYRFGSLTCSDGGAALPVAPCPWPLRRPPKSWFTPTRSLNEPLRAVAVAQSRGGCRAAFLIYPCYRAEVEFTAPYAVTRAGAEYDVTARSSCKNARLSGWSIDHDIQQGETVRTISTGSFRFCASPEELEVSYLNPQGPSARSPHESVVVGTGTLGKAGELGKLAERVPAGVSSIAVARGPTYRHMTVRRTIGAAGSVRRIVAAIDGLAIVQPGTWVCPAEPLGPVVRLTFRDHAGGVLAKAVQAAGTEVGDCSPMYISVRGHEEKPLAEGASVIDTVSQITGIRPL